MKVCPSSRSVGRPEAEKKATPESDARSWCSAGSKMDSDTTIRRIKPFVTQTYAPDDNGGLGERCGNNGYGGEPERKPEVSLYLLREGLAASVVSVFILVLWGLVHLSLQQLVIGKPTGDFSALTARWEAFASQVTWSRFCPSRIRASAVVVSRLANRNAWKPALVTPGNPSRLDRWTG